MIGKRSKVMPSHLYRSLYKQIKFHNNVYTDVQSAACEQIAKTYEVMYITLAMANALNGRYCGMYTLPSKRK